MWCFVSALVFPDLHVRCLHIMPVVTLNIVVGQPHNLHTYWSVCQKLVKRLYSSITKLQQRQFFKSVLQKVYTYFSWFWRKTGSSYKKISGLLYYFIVVLVYPIILHYRITFFSVVNKRAVKPNLLMCS